MNMKFHPQRPEICDAIRNKQQIAFLYHGKLRKGNPQCYGINKKGKEALRVHLVEGGSRPEQMFLLDDALDFKIQNEHFVRPGPNYHKGDKDMVHIFCELDDD
ncbi:hypothetical protein [Chryseolinea sp. H1M3-3]|uniref:hypothetical protein n=1 Tax=Chryseolinea sp. H1M3-3 TaxID=3034144 RepID=UPI0023EA79E1|nr:hypothetical protein [Chryseolinea sp. H1M3-3]